MAEEFHKEWNKPLPFTLYEAETIKKCGLPKMESSDEEFDENLNCILPNLCPKSLHFYVECMKTKPPESYSSCTETGKALMACFGSFAVKMKINETIDYFKDREQLLGLFSGVKNEEKKKV